MSCEKVAAAAIGFFCVKYMTCFLCFITFLLRYALFALSRKTPAQVSGGGLSYAHSRRRHLLGVGGGHPGKATFEISLTGACVRACVIREHCVVTLLLLLLLLLLSLSLLSSTSSLLLLDVACALVRLFAAHFLTCVCVLRAPPST